MLVLSQDIKTITWSANGGQDVDLSVLNTTHPLGILHLLGFMFRWSLTVTQHASVDIEGYQQGRFLVLSLRQRTGCAQPIIPGIDGQDIQAINHVTLGRSPWVDTAFGVGAGSVTRSGRTYVALASTGSPMLPGLGAVGLRSWEQSLIGLRPCAMYHGGNLNISFRAALAWGTGPTITAGSVTVQAVYAALPARRVIGPQVAYGIASQDASDQLLIPGRGKLLTLAMAPYDGDVNTPYSSASASFQNCLVENLSVAQGVAAWNMTKALASGDMLDEDAPRYWPIFFQTRRSGPQGAPRVRGKQELTLSGQSASGTVRPVYMQLLPADDAVGAAEADGLATTREVEVGDITDGAIAGRIAPYLPAKVSDLAKGQ